MHSPYFKRKAWVIKMQTRLGVLVGAGTVTVETGTKYCFKDATNIICASEVLIPNGLVFELVAFHWMRNFRCLLL